MPPLMSLLLQAFFTALAFFLLAFLTGAVIGAGYAGYIAATAILL